MKPLTIVVLFWTSVPGLAGAFVNFTFDEIPRDPTVLVEVGGPGGVYRGSPENVLPGWEVVYQGSPLEHIGYSIPNHRGSIPPVTLREYNPGEPFGQVGGRNALWLRMGDPPPTPTVDLILRQRAEIPADAVSFEIRHSGRGIVRIDGDIIHEFDSEVNYNPIVDVSPYAGREVSLEFAFYRGDALSFDVLGFSTVPEPSTWALVGIAALGLGWGAMRGRRGSGKGAQ